MNRQLEAHGIKVKNSQGVLLDATIVASEARPRTTIEGNKSYFGYRGYAIAEEEKGHHECLQYHIVSNACCQLHIAKVFDMVHIRESLTD